MRQTLTTDTVQRHINAPPELVYDIVADVTRMPELSPEIARSTWLTPEAGARPGARFRSVNKAGRLRWPNRPIVLTADRGREFAFARTEPFTGTITWRYRFTPDGQGTTVTESYEVMEPVTTVGWFIIGTLAGLKDRAGDLRRGMTETLDRLAALAQDEARRQFRHRSPGPTD
jgi:uncharacterized protein YndB with AHSA1/START domain